MPLPIPDLITARLDRLEREGRRWETRGFRNLNGPDGRARATMTLMPGRGAALALADAKGAVVWSAPP